MSLEFDLRLPRRDFVLDLQGSFESATVGIFGPSGAGKTSLFGLLAGLEQPSEGRIVLNGRVLADTKKDIFIPASKRRIGVVFQEKLLFPHMTVLENLCFGIGYSSSRKVSLERVVELLDLSSLLSSMPADISGGEQQRVAVGRALLTSPELLLLDEPFNAVDNSLRSVILPYIRRLRDELKIPMLVISHDLPDIQRLTDQVYLVDKGRCAGYGRVFDLFGKGGFSEKGHELVNVLKLSDPQARGDGLYGCRVSGAPGVHIKSPVAVPGEFSLVIHPHEIALASRKIDGISIQNQLCGRIERFVEKERGVYCMIDAGVKLAAELTSAAVKEMKLEEGLDVVCLFKAHALSR